MKFKEYIILYIYPNRFWGILVNLSSIFRRFFVDFGRFLVNLSSIFRRFFSLRDKCFGLWGVASLSETGRLN
jgi:hypothetical protein